MSIVSTHIYLRKLLTGLFIVLTLQTVVVSLANYLPTVDGVQAAECEDGTCG